MMTIKMTKEQALSQIGGEWNKKPPNRPPSCDRLISEVTPCPFCGIVPERGGKMLTRDRRGIVDQLRHPVTGKCPLDMLVFRKPEWEKQNSTPRLSGIKELLRLVDEAKRTRSESEYFPHALHNIYSYADKLRKEWKL